MKKQLCLTLLTAGAVAVPVPSATADDKLSVHYMKYREHDDKVEVGDSVVALEKDFGVDYTLNADFGYDSVSGASPALQPVRPGSSLTSVDQQRFATATTKTAATLLGYDAGGAYTVRKTNLTDTRKSANFSLTMRDEKRHETTVGVSYSKEEDYVSRGISGQYLWYANAQKNRSYTVGGSWLHDTSDVFGTAYSRRYKDDLDIVNLEAGLSQILSPTSYMDLTLFGTISRGYLSNHYLTIVRRIDTNENGVIDLNERFLGADDRPREREAFGVTTRFVRQLSDTSVLQTTYRFYNDSWKIRSHTLDIDLSWDVFPELTLMPRYSYYSQSAASFFRDPEAADNSFNALEYGSSDLRLGDFDAHTWELGLSYHLQKDFSFDVSIADYQQSNDFNARWAVAGMTWKF
ncbi:MAG: DUF3570 domain-containing protein [Marinobacterium sp.]|nr:DUF3570 domain-containing protein [Marinobacterium sp.]